MAAFMAKREANRPELEEREAQQALEVKKARLVAEEKKARDRLEQKSEPEQGQGMSR
jgi:hypothetical protein